MTHNSVEPIQDTGVDSKSPQLARKAQAGQVDTRCGMCGSTAIDHTELDCKTNRGIYSFNLRPVVTGRSTCMHDNCPSCHGTGRGAMGTCVHMMSCPCPKCSPTMMTGVSAVGVVL